MRKTTAMLAVLSAAWFSGDVRAQNKLALDAEAERVAVVRKVKPSVVAIFAKGGQGGGTGVLISEDGYALTNFHVVQPTGPTMQCGLPDGILYDAVLVGLDKVGDVALIKLLPKKEGAKFPFATLGDSDKVREGEWSLAMGNPFLLATDFNPTITFGLVSGVNRYQYPAGILLEYTDCIQIDTSINPGNSGGPLFNMKGELIGINGRGSFDKRARINSGVGYAISINQIKNFMGHLRAGLDTDHASLGATVATETEKSGLGKVRVREVLEDSDAARRGLDIDDELVSFAGRSMGSVNHFKNVLGIYPRDWRLPLEFRRERAKKEVLVRLMGVQRKALKDDGLPPDVDPELPKVPRPKEGPAPKFDPKKMKAPPPSGPAAKYYEAAPGFANYHFNKLEKDRTLALFSKTQGTEQRGDWSFEGTVRLKKLRTESPVKFDLRDEPTGDGKSSQPVASVVIENFPYKVEPLKPGQEPPALRQPDTSGGLLASLYVWRRFLTEGAKGFGDFRHAGVEPVYPPDASVKSPAATRIDALVLVGRHGPFDAKWFVHPTDGKLLAMEVRMRADEDPCELHFSDYRDVDGRQFPHRIVAVHGDATYGTFTIARYTLRK